MHVTQINTHIPTKRRNFFNMATLVSSEPDTDLFAVNLQIPVDLSSAAVSKQAVHWVASSPAHSLQEGLHG